MLQALTEGFTLGLATGVVCLSTCTPIYLPYLLSSDRKLWKSFVAIMEISAGRFFSYLTFGAIAGFLGAQISQVNREVFTAIAYILLSIYLISSAIRTRNEHKKCAVPKFAAMTRSAFVLGILTGINFCPAFLIALSNAMNLAGPLSGMLLFLGFFFGTSLFLIPLAFANFLTRIRQMKSIAQLASVLIGIWFIARGLFMLYGFATGTIETSRFAPGKQLSVISSEAHLPYFEELRDSLEARKGDDVALILYREDTSIEKKASNLFFVDEALVEADSSAFSEIDYFAVESGYNIGDMMVYLNTIFQQCPSESESGENNNACSSCSYAQGIDFSGKYPVDFKQDDARVMDVFAPGNSYVILADSTNAYWKSFQGELQMSSRNAVRFEQFESIEQLSRDDNIVYFIPIELDESLTNDGWIDSLHTVAVPEDYIQQTVVSFLKKFTFKIEDRLSWRFDR